MTRIPSATTASILIEDQVEIPVLQDLDAFRRWASSDRFPENGRIDYIAAHIEVDMSPEDVHACREAELGDGTISFCHGGQA